MKLFRTVVLVALCVALPMASRAQEPKKVTKEASVTATATIRAIDKATRSVTLRTENGDEDSFTVAPEVTRFDQLKVGDTIRVTYYESLVFQLRAPGAKPNAQADALMAGRIKATPGGAAASKQTRTVTVKAVDLAVPSITVVTEDGRTLTRKVADKKNIEGVKVGDHIDITYTQALVINAEPAK